MGVGANAIDSFDRKLLALVHENSRRPTRSLVEAVGVSTAACHKRLQRLRSDGVIEREIAILSPEKLGRPLTLIVLVRLQAESVESLQQIQRSMSGAPEVMQCCHITGEDDFIVILTTRDMEE